MPAQRFTVSSTATGTRRSVVVWVYDTQEEMVAAATAYSPGSADMNTAGTCHSFGGIVPPPPHERFRCIVRLCRPYLDLETFSHEMVHAACAIYAHDKVGQYSRAVAHIHAGNETLAYLAGELIERTNSNLHRLGYY